MILQVDYPPSQDASHHQDDITFLVAHPELKLQFSTFAGKEDNPRNSVKQIGGVFVSQKQLRNSNKKVRKGWHSHNTGCKEQIW